MYGKKGTVHTQCELMELSAVPIPAHRDALAMRGISPSQAKSILNVEETDEAWVVTYAKYQDDAAEEDAPEDEESEPVQEQAEDEEDEELTEDEESDEEDEEDEESDEYEERQEPDEPEEDDEDEDDDEEDDEDEQMSFAPYFTRHPSDLKPLVRAALIELIGSEPTILEPTTDPNRGLAAMFGIDK